MSLANTPAAYGTVAKSFHWTTAALILAAIQFGFYADSLPYGTGEELARKAFWFSFHKTIGVTIFFVAVARIAWTLTQRKPGLLNADRPLERRAAEAVHWLLYVSLVIVPLSGWLHHAASEGFAPIWWPFGQALPLVPKSESVSTFFAAWHWIFARVLIAALVLHVAGAIKHAVIDRDGTLRRMLPGRTPVEPPAQPDDRLPVIFAAAVVVAAMALGSVIGLDARRAATAMPAPAETTPGGETVETPRVAEAGTWMVEDGTLAITVRQLGNEITGSFATWDADIAFDAAAEGSVLGNVDVQVDIGSLTLGSVTRQALGAEFLAAGEHPRARFVADIRRADDGYVADGTLDLRGSTIEVRLPFDLVIENDTARMTGTLPLDRRDFGIGMSYPDAETVGHAVEVAVELAARRME
jgi:cytochrome b561/polyisoprenoid-binding protein YceI